MTLLEQHLAEQHLQQDWVNADPATAFFLALTLQMEAQDLLSSSPVFASSEPLDLSEQTDRLAEKVVAHLAAHPQLRDSPVTASASAAAAAATAGSRSWRKAVEDDSGGSMVGDGMISAAAHYLQLEIIKLSVTLEGLVETVFPPPTGLASRGTLVVVYVGGVVWSTSPMGSGSRLRAQVLISREALGLEGSTAAAAAAAAAAAGAAGAGGGVGSEEILAGNSPEQAGWFSQEAISDELTERLIRAKAVSAAVKWFSSMRCVVCGVWV